MENAQIVVKPASSRSTFWRNALLVGVIATLVLMCLGVLTVGHEGFHVMVMDEDGPDSFLGLLIAVPVLILVAIFVTAVVFGAGMLAAGAVFFAVVVAALAVALAALPFIAFFAVPVLIIVGLVKWLSPKARQGNV